RIAFDATLAAYLGRPPSQFEFEGARYTPRSFADERVAIDPDKYVEVTSYSHLAANGFSPLEIPANYRKRRYLNLPFRDFARVVDVALAAGFSLAWDGDVSEPGWKDAAGTAHLPDGVGVDAELRDRHFRSGKTADEHNMHLVGRATDERNEVYYVLKNSEGPNANGGFVLMHREYLLLKTVSLLVHQDALPADVRRRVRRLKPRGG
ncbi:MAG: aminopeptidase, partial [Myxococcota bacterium]